ncbi:creC [Candida margitis]|uniref:creC n=1 Tax=Candida margitis TaxID=1775924 RepID=UPI0022261004|nr:creC [Candida margitis]KAI5959035.1 creC [Candida margitis]
MTSTTPNTSDATFANTTMYLNSVCPGYTQLEDNEYHSLPNDMPRSTAEIAWPVTNGKSINAKLKLESDYLNIARPPLGPFESTTYVSLPLHLVNAFKEKVQQSDKRSEGNMHIGANVNPLTQDPFRNPNMNPGALTTIVETRTRFQSKNPFNKLTTNLNKLFTKDEFYDNVEASDVSILSYNDDFASCGRLLVSTNVNVLNVLGLSESSQFEHTKVRENESKIEQPLLRLQLSSKCVITSLTAFVFHEEPIIILGCNQGKVVIVKPRSMKMKQIDLNLNSPESINLVNVSTVHAIRHPLYEYLIVTGTSNGEVFILNPLGRNEMRNYKKEVVGTDSYVTYFRKFDLSLFGEPSDDQLIGHFKLCHKSITAISSTLSVENALRNDLQPLLLAVASEDGFVKFIDFMFTYRLDQEEVSSSLVTDIVSNYFNTGISDIKFSPDFKFFSIVGKGDLIEVFKMTYYNINGLLRKPERQGRSRSGTVNSHNSLYTSMTATQSLHDHGQEKSYPPMVKSIEIVCRFKGHTNSVRAIQFFNDNNSSSSSNDSLSVYKLVSCGNDGKIFVWEFDYKAVPKVKKPQAVVSQSKPRESRRSIHEKKNSIHIVTHSPSPGPIHSRSAHRRNLSTSDPILNTPSFTNLLSTKSLNLTSVLSDDPSPKPKQPETIISLYKQLLDIRVKKSPQKKFIQSSTIISPIVNDKYLPSISIPLVTIDLTSIVPDGKIDNVVIEKQAVWCFCKNGDIFKYAIYRE